MRKPFLLLLLALQLSFSSSEISEFELKLQKFLVEIKKAYLHNCDFLIVEDGPSEDDFTRELLLKLRWAMGDNTGTLLDMSKIHRLEQLQNFSISLSSFDDIHRFNPSCSLVFIHLSTVFTRRTQSRVTREVSTNIEGDPLTELSDMLFWLLTKHYGPITRKDDDFYIGLTPTPKEFNNVLKMKFFQKLRSRLLISLTPYEGTSNELAATSGCFFCWPHEDPKIPLDLNPWFQAGEAPPNLDILFPDITKDFQGRKIRITTAVRIHFCVEFEQLKTGYLKLKRGHQANVLLEIQRRRNFTYIIFPGYAGGGTGERLKNGTWTGTTSDIYYERADLAMATFHIYLRDQILGFSWPFIYVRLIFVVSLPKALYTADQILWPLSTITWAYLGSTVVASYIVFILINRFGVHEPGASQSWGAWSTMEFTTGSFFEQGLAVTKRKSGRIFCILWLFFILVSSTAYKSSLLEILMFPKLTSPPRTFYDLAESKGYTYGLENAGIGGAIHADFKTSTHPTFKKINQRMTLERDSVKCFQKSLEEEFGCMAYMAQTTLIFYKNFSTSSRKFPFLISDETTFAPHKSGFAMEKRAVFMDSFDKIIGPLLENGFIDKWHDEDYEEMAAKRIRWQKAEKLDPFFTEDFFYTGPRTLNLDNFEGIFLIYSVMMAISAACFIIEHAFRLIYENAHKVKKINLKQQVQKLQKLQKFNLPQFKMKFNLDVLDLDLGPSVTELERAAKLRAGNPKISITSL